MLQCDPVGGGQLLRGFIPGDVHHDTIPGVLGDEVAALLSFSAAEHMLSDVSATGRDALENDVRAASLHVTAASLMSLDREAVYSPPPS